MIISQVANRLGVQTSTIRYYERIGLLPPALRSSGRRVYGDEVLWRLLVIRTAKAAGFTLAEIKILMKGFAPGRRAPKRWARMAQSKLEELEARADEINKMKDLLHAGLACGALRPEDCQVLIREPGSPVTPAR